MTTLRTFSISAGLAASTVTPGSTAPEVSLTTPAMPPAACARATMLDACIAATTRHTRRSVAIQRDEPLSAINHYGGQSRADRRVRVTVRLRGALRVYLGAGG